MHHEHHAVLYRARRASAQDQVLIKTFQMDYPSPQEVAQLKHEYEMAKRAASLGVLAPIGLEQYRHTWLLLMEDFGGDLLAHVLDETQLTLSRFFDIAIPLIEAVLQLHRKNIIHKDLRPHNIFVHPAQRVVKLTNFSVAAWLFEEQSELVQPHLLEQSLSYISPEQTGRMNRSADHRSDLYSVGVVLYEMLTGRLPFEEQESVELIYQHLTQEPVPPAVLDPRLPIALSDLLLKCLAKNAEVRYQSAYGLLHDLQTIEEQWLAQGRVAEFTLGQADRSEHFSLSKNLYGRERELQMLADALARTRLGGGEAVLVSGPSGIGKSTLVREMKRRALQEHVYFLEGKFEQNKPHAPYEGVLQALKQWVLQIVAEGEGSIAWWKDQLVHTLGPRIGVLVEAIPELNLLVGPQLPMPTLPALETNNRFLLAILQLISLLPTAQHPILLFLDDLQWADPASLNLISILLTERKVPNLLLIGSYREEEQEGTQLQNLISRQKERQVPLVEIHLTPLGVDEVQQLLQDTLRSSAEEVALLTQAVTKKTGGSPFLVKQFVLALPTKGLLSLEAQTGEWRWDIDAINSLEVNESQVEYILGNIRQFPERVRKMLGTAACIGTTFNVETLNHVLEEDISVLAADLLLLIEERLLDPGGQNQLQFAHDRIQQAAYELLTEEERKHVHLKLGRWLWKRTSGQVSEDSRYEQVNHFSQALDRLSSSEEREAVARLHLAVAKHAKAATAYEQALRYCHHGIGLLGESCWRDQHELAYELYREQFELESLCGHVEAADQIFELLLDKAWTDLEKLSIYKFRILAYSKENKSHKSIELGLHALKKFGMVQPLKSDWRSLSYAFVHIRRRLTKKRTHQLTHLPDASNTKAIAQMEILWAMAAVILVVDYKMMVRLILKILELSLEHGHAAPSGSAYIIYGNLVAQLGEHELGATYGQLGVATEADYWERQGTVSCQGLFSFTTNIMPFTAPIRRVNDSFADVLQWAQEAGDLRIFGNGLIMKAHAMIISGLPLAEVQAELQNGLHTVRISKTAWLLQASQILLGTVRSLLGLATGPTDLSHDDFDEEQYRHSVLESRTPKQVNPLNYCYSKFLLLFLAGEYDEALCVAQEIEQERMFPRGHFVEVNFFYLYALTLTIRSDRLEEPQRKREWKQFQRLRKKVQAAARRCPDNYLHKLILLDAETARIRRHRQRAMDLYDQAVTQSLEHQFWNDEGIAHECAANFYLGIGKTAIANTYLQAARQAFLKWGAVSKASQLAVRYPHVFEEGGLSTDRRENNVDHLAAIKAAQAISSEIVLENLMEKMMQILLENAGAQVGTMLFEQNGQWVAHDERVEVSQSVIQYVTRTSESVVLHDACHEGLFRNDPSLQGRQVKSLLCLPIRHQAKQVGLLYVENNLTTHAFTSERLELLELLSTQFAISIENAHLYSNLEENVRMRTADLVEVNRQLENSIQETARAWSDVAVLEERTRIAHEFHDVIGHTLTTAVVQLESCKRLAAKDPTGALQSLDAVQDNLRNGLHEVRVSVRMLKDNISQMEIGQALEKLLIEMQVQLGLQIEYQMDPMPKLDAKVRKILYHALQEGLTNGVRHGKSTHFHFQLQQQQGIIHFELRDNGVGFQVGVFGFGLTSMRERVEQAGGNQQVISSPGNGCTLRLTLPIVVPKTNSPTSASS